MNNKFPPNEHFSSENYEIHPKQVIVLYNTVKSIRCFCLPYFGIEGGAASREIAIGYFDGTIPSEYSQLRPTTACLAEYDYSLIWIPALVSHNLPPPYYMQIYFNVSLLQSHFHPATTAWIRMQNQLCLSQ